MKSNSKLSLFFSFCFSLDEPLGHNSRLREPMHRLIVDQILNVVHAAVSCSASPRTKLALAWVRTVLCKQAQFFFLGATRTPQDAVAAVQPRSGKEGRKEGWGV